MPIMKPNPAEIIFQKKINTQTTGGGEEIAYLL